MRHRRDVDCCERSVVMYAQLRTRRGVRMKDRTCRRSRDPCTVNRLAQGATREPLRYGFAGGQHGQWGSSQTVPLQPQVPSNNVRSVSLITAQSHPELCILTRCGLVEY